MATDYAELRFLEKDVEEDVEAGLKCLVCGKEIENEDESIYFCGKECRSRYRPGERGVHMPL